MRTKKLQRQLKRAFQSESIESDLQALRDARPELAGELAPESPPLDRVVAGFGDFLTSIESAYAQSERLLEVASRSLEVGSRELTDANRSLEGLYLQLNGMMNSLGQGFLTFDRSGVIGKIYSRVCLELLECQPAGRTIHDVLKIPEDNRSDFANWIEMLFLDRIDFDDLAQLGPKLFPHSQGRYVTLEFKPIRALEGMVEAVVVVATDQTRERDARQEALERQQYADMVVKLATERNQFLVFVKRARSVIEMVRSKARQKKISPLDLRDIRGELHTFKGGAASFYIRELRELAHRMESEIEALAKSGAYAADSRRPAVLFEEIGIALETALNRFLTAHRDLLGDEFERSGYRRQVPIEDLYGFIRELAAMPGSEGLTNRFLEEIVAISLSELIAQHNSSNRALAAQLGKEVGTIEYAGDDIKILVEVYEDVLANLVHLFRNSIDHGIELPEERVLKGKPAAGKIRVHVALDRSRQPYGTIALTIEDDGRGIAPNHVRRKLEEQGLADEATQADDAEIIQHIFDAGFSTRDQVSEISGRGVGLDAFKYAVEQLGGSVRVHSQLDHFTRFEVRLPHITQIDFAHSRDQTPATPSPRRT